MVRPTHKDMDFMRYAIAKARAGVRAGQSPFGSCIVRDGTVICVAHNRVWKNKDITAHAEIVAIRAACRRLETIDLKGCVLYSTCEPCPMCFSACHWAKISKVVFGVRIADAKKLGYSELTIATQRMKTLGKSPLHLLGDCLRQENFDLFRLWSVAGTQRVY